MHVILGGLMMAVALFCSSDPLLASVTDDYRDESSAPSRHASASSVTLVAHFAVVLDDSEVRYVNFPLSLRDAPSPDDTYKVGDEESMHALSCMILNPDFFMNDHGEPSHYKLFLSRSMERNTIVLPCAFKGAKIHYALTLSKEFEDCLDFCVCIEGVNGAVYKLESWVFPRDDCEDGEESVVKSEVFDDYFTKDAVLAVLGSKERLPIDHGCFMIDPKKNLDGEMLDDLYISLTLKQLRPYGRDPLRIDVGSLPFKVISQDVFETDSLSYLNPYLDGITFKIDIQKLSGESCIVGPNQNNTYELVNNDVRAYSSLYFILARTTTHFHLSVRLQLSPIGGGSAESLEESQHRYIASFPMRI